MTNKSITLLNGQKIFGLVIGVVVIGLIAYMIFYWFGGQREIDNKKDELMQWTQNATILEKTNHWWGTSCLLSADDGKRYYDDSCSKYLNGDKVIILMYKDHYRWIKGLV